MKKLLSTLLVLTLTLALLSATAFAAGNPDFSKYSDKELQQLYEAVRDEMINRKLPLAQELTLREGLFIVGEDILPGGYTIRCTETFGETYGDTYSSLGGLLGGDLGGLMDSLGGMMSDLINAEVEILGEYGTILKTFELKAGESAHIMLSEGNALQISNGTCVLIAD